MRVLLITDFYRPVVGGLEEHVRALARELGRRGHVVCVATLTRDPARDEGVDVLVIRSAARLLPHENPERPFHPPLPDPVARAALRRVIRSWRPDIVHAHSWLGVSAPRKSGVPFVVTAHDYALICQLHTLFHPWHAPCSGPAANKCIRCGAQMYGRAKSVPLTWGTAVGRWLLAPDRIVAVSDAVAAAIRPYVRALVVTIPNFIESDRPRARPPSGLDRRGFVLFAGEALPHKGIDTLADLWTGADRLRHALVVASHRVPVRRLPPWVTTASLTRPRVHEAMCQAAVCVVPSEWPDPAPTVVLEAMATGTPVLGSQAESRTWCLAQNGHSHTRLATGAPCGRAWMARSAGTTDGIGVRPCSTRRPSGTARRESPWCPPRCIRKLEVLRPMSLRWPPVWPRDA